MKNFSRRTFLNIAAGTAGAGSFMGRAPFLNPAAEPHPGQQPHGPAVYADPSFSDGSIFPTPQQITYSGPDFLMDSSVRILTGSGGTQNSLFLARFLIHELSDRFGLHPAIDDYPPSHSSARVVVMGSIWTPVVRQYLSRLGLEERANELKPEGYLLHVNRDVILVAGYDEAGAFYGLQSLRQLLFLRSQHVYARGAQICDWPDKPFRGIYLYLPGRRNISFFKRFIRDYMALYKYNTLIIEMGASMRLDRHPELNSGWIDFARDCDYSCRNYPPDPYHGVQQNSSHQDVADGGFLEKEEVADLARWITKHHIELIPEIASFTHSYYLLTRHRNLAAVPQDKWPDIYCPSNPDVYPLVYDVYDEYLELLKPRIVHIGHDELFLPLNASTRCCDSDIGDLYGKDVRKIHDHLAHRGVKTALWGDMLLQSVRGHGPQRHTAQDGWIYYTPGGLTPAQVEKWIPRDCLIFNWFWAQNPGHPGGDALQNEATLDQMGFQQIYGNLKPSITDYEQRKMRTTLLGGAPSAWFATNETGFGRELMDSFLGCSEILWSGKVMTDRELQDKVQTMTPAIRQHLSGITPPSATENSVVPLDISQSFNTSGDLPELKVNIPPSSEKSLRFHRMVFQLKSWNGRHGIVVGTEGTRPTGLPRAVTGIPIRIAPTSLIFLHAAARPAANRESFRILWDQQDTADLLGWYEVVYEDGFIITIPVRYGLNILNWQHEPPKFTKHFNQRWYCYEADALNAGEVDRPVIYYAYEWINPRLGKVIREIHLKGTTQFRGASEHFSNAWGPVIEDNAILLKAISAVPRRT